MSDTSTPTPKRRFKPYLWAGCALLVLWGFGRGCACARGNGGDSEPPQDIAVPQVSEPESAAAWDTIALINHINYVVEVIRTYNNVVALEEEYWNISADNLNLNRIPDQEALTLIRNILNALREMRMNDRQRKWCQRVLTRNLDGAKLARTAQIATNVAESTRKAVTDGKGFFAGLKAIVADTAVATVNAHFDYKQAERTWQAQWEDKQFELDTEKLEALYELNDSLLVHQWTLIQKYHLPDRLRITSREVKSLVDCLKDTNPKRCYQRLKPMAKQFEVYPTYWHYRAAMALASGQYTDVLASCDRFNQINRGLFRFDPMVANVSMFKIAALVELGRTNNPEDKEDIRQCLAAICSQNFNSSNAEQGIFCVSVYLSVLEDPDAALEVLNPLSATLSEATQKELLDYRDLFTKPDEPKTPVPNAADLAQCRMLRMAIDQQKGEDISVERLLKICERETTASLEKLFYFGQLRVDDLWKVAKNDVVKLNLGIVDGNICIQIPVSWFLLGNLGVGIELLQGDKVLVAEKDDESNRQHVMARPWWLDNARDEAYVQIFFSVAEQALAASDGIRLHLQHVSWPVEILYVFEEPWTGENMALVPVTVERFMSREVGKEVLPNPVAAAQEELESLEAEAAAGDADAQLELGLRYWEGDGVPEDNEEAAKYFRKAAEQGLAEAQTWMGNLLESGIGVTANDAEASSWYQEAAKQGDEEAQYRFETLEADSKWHILICDALRSSGIPLGEDFCLANRNTANESHPKRDQAVADVNDKLPVWLLAKDVLFWNNPPRASRSTVLITAKSLFYLEDDEVLCWDWKDIQQLDWVRSTNGNLIINGKECRFLVDYRKPFVDAMTKVLERIRKG